MTRASFIVTFIVAFLAVPLAAGPRQAPDPDPQRGGRGDEEEAIRYLNMTSEQKEKLRLLRDARDKDVMPLRLQEQERNAELRLLWLQLKPDPAKIKLKLKQIHDLKWQIQEKDADYWIAFRDLLTPDQLSSFLTLVGDRIFKPKAGPPKPRDDGEDRPGGPRRPPPR